MAYLADFGPFEDKKVDSFEMRTLRPLISQQAMIAASDEKTREIASLTRQLRRATTDIEQRVSFGYKLKSLLLITSALEHGCHTSVH